MWWLVPEQNEIQKFKSWDLDIEPHREKMNEQDLETRFKDENDPFRIVIVCAMWITGFDVPSLSTMYIDKPLKSHTLMQAIARANRINEGKNNGLIVDYIETYRPYWMPWLFMELVEKIVEVAEERNLNHQ